MYLHESLNRYLQFAQENILIYMFVGMGKVDTVTKAYMRKNNIFADAFNYLIYGMPRYRYMR